MNYYSNGLPGTMQVPMPIPTSVEKRSPYGAGPPFASPYASQSTVVNGVPAGISGMPTAVSGVHSVNGMPSAINGVQPSVNGVPPTAHMHSAGPGSPPGFALSSQMNPSGQSASSAGQRAQFGQAGQYAQMAQLGGSATYSNQSVPQQPMPQYPRVSTYLAPIPSSVTAATTQSPYAAKQYITAGYPSSQMPTGMSGGPAYPGGMPVPQNHPSMNPLYQPGAISAMPGVPGVAAATGSPYAMQAFPSSAYGLGSSVSFPGGAAFRPPF